MPHRLPPRSRYALFTLLLLAGAMATRTSDAADARAPAPTCHQVQAPDCLYVPASRHGFAAYARSTSYTDISGRQREVRFLVRQPLGAPAPMPAVVWSHGGADGKSDPAMSMVEWSEATAAAGYFTVSIAHANRSTDSRRGLCLSLGVAGDATCEVFKYLNWDRPHDIRAVLDEIERMNASGEFVGQIDVRRIAVGGHSAGSGGAQTVGGAKRLFVSAPVDLSDPRPIAFIALSPQQPGSEGFFDTRFGTPGHSWSDMQRPVLTATGDGDSTCNPGPEPGSCIGDTPFGRRIGFQRMPGLQDKYQLYVHDANAFHTLFQLNASKCDELNVDRAKCDEMVRWLTSAGLAFLDGHVRGTPAALQWLQSDRIERASRGVAEWLRK